MLSAACLPRIWLPSVQVGRTGSGLLSHRAGVSVVLWTIDNDPVIPPFIRLGSCRFETFKHEALLFRETTRNGCPIPISSGWTFVGVVENILCRIDFMYRERRYVWSAQVEFIAFAASCVETLECGVPAKVDDFSGDASRQGPDSLAPTSRSLWGLR